MGAAAGTAVLVLALFAVANFFYQAGLVFYDALLANVSDETTRGRVSGLGIAYGYGGAILSLYSVAPIAERFGKWAAFPATAAFFLVFALPCLLLVPDGVGRDDAAGSAGRTTLRAWRPSALRERLRSTLAMLRRHPGLGRFLVAHFLYTDAVNTVILFMAVYATVVGGFSSAEVTRLLALSTVFAIVGAVGEGHLVDRLGAKRALFVALGLWVLGLVLAITAIDRTMLWMIGPITGAALGALWASDRVLMFRLSPPASLGEAYGVYGMIGRFAAITGPLIWGGVVYALEGTGNLAYRAAAASLLVMLLAGIGVLVGVPDPGARRVDR
jgi:UMF1 family MFS transporter